MADSFTQVAPDSTGDKIDTEQLTVGANTVERQRVQLAGAVAAEIARILNADPSTSDYGLVTRPAAHVPAVTATGTLGAVDNAVTVAVQGRPYVSFNVDNDAATANMELICEFSSDGGTTWEERYFWNGDSWVGWDILPHNQESVRNYGVLSNAADTHIRLRVDTYTSGSVDVIGTASGTVPAELLLAINVGPFQVKPVTFDGANDQIVVPVGYRPGIEFAVEAGTLAATLTMDASTETHGVTWQQTGVLFWDGVQLVSSKTLTNPNGLKQFVPLVGPNVRRVRLVVSSYTSGSAVAKAHASHHVFPLVPFLASIGYPGLAAPLFPVAVGARDAGGTHRALRSDSDGRIVVRPWGASSFAKVHTPAANTQATITQAAAGAGVRNVCTGITATLAANTTAPGAAAVTVELRDGASGAGTILWQARLSLPATAGATNGIALSNLHIRGTANTAMTLEFSGTAGANTFESVSLQGCTVTEA